MSYVLNALRRAESERARGQVPDVHAQPLPSTSGDDGALDRGFRWPWAVGGLVVALFAGTGVWWWRGAPAPQDTASGPATAQRSSTADGSTPGRPSAAPPAAATALPGPATLPAPPAPVPQVVVRIEAPPPAPARIPPTPAPRPAAGTAPAATPAPVPAAAAAPASPVKKWAELPESFRRQLPSLSFGGAMDSPVAANRMLIINGQVFREGEEPAPGLVLERITLRAATLRYQGQSFEIGY